MSGVNSLRNTPAPAPVATDDTPSLRRLDDAAPRDISQLGLRDRAIVSAKRAAVGALPALVSSGAVGLVSGPGRAMFSPATGLKWAAVGGAIALGSVFAANMIGRNKSTRETLAVIGMSAGFGVALSRVPGYAGNGQGLSLGEQAVVKGMAIATGVFPGLIIGKASDELARELVPVK